MSYNEKTGFHSENLLNFSVAFKCCLHSVNLYHLIITSSNNNLCYSYYFRYNTLLQIHDYAKSNPRYPKTIIFPPKKKWFWQKNIIREQEFQFFFNSLSNEKITNIGKSLELFGLMSNFSLSSNLAQKWPNELNPTIFKLVLNGRSFYFVKKRELGRRGYGIYFLYSLNDVDQKSHEFAVKLIDLDVQQDSFREQLINSILAESKISMKFKHQNIVKNYLFCKGNQRFVMKLMEFCNSGSLWDYVQQKKKQISFLEESEIKEIFLEILKGIQYIRYYFKSRGKSEIFIHRDLKLSTILIHRTVDGKRIIKIGNCQMGKIYIEGSNPKASREANKDYQSPETATGEEISDKCDIWSLGIILYEMCYFEYPWLNKRTDFQKHEKQKQLSKGKNLEFEGKQRKISSKMIQIMRKMLRFEENERMSFEELFEHEFFSAELEKDKIKLKTLKRRKSYEEKIENNKSLNLSFIENQDDSANFFDYLEQIDKDKSIFQEPIQHKIKIELKKIQNQIIFLDYFDDQLASFNEEFPDLQIANNKSGLEFKKNKILNQNILRIILQKLSLAIGHKLLNEFENFAEKNEVWQSKSDLIKFLSQNPDYLANYSQIINNSIIRFRKIQENVLSDAIFHDSNKSSDDVNEFLELINPQIKNWTDFKKNLESYVQPIVETLQKFVIPKENSVFLLKDKLKKSARAGVFLRNFIVVMDMKHNFEDMNDEEVNDFSYERLITLDEVKNFGSENLDLLR